MLRWNQPLPSGDAGRVKLILDGKALLSFIPLNHEVLFSAGAITHMGTPLFGRGFNARAILYSTAALERSVGHFEAAEIAAAKDGTTATPHMMNAADKRRLIDETDGVLTDTSKPPLLTEEQLANAVDEWCSGELRTRQFGFECPGNVEAAFTICIDSLAELGVKLSLADTELLELLDEYLELKREARSTTQGECYGPPAFPSQELRYQLLSPRIRKAANELIAQGRRREAAVLRCQFALIASIFTAPFLAFIFDEGLLYDGDDQQRRANAEAILEWARRWEGDEAQAAYLAEHPCALCHRGRARACASRCT